ncbi:MAG TPA: 3',5'-cyclic-nucleotide phosphodiesterase [Geothrix sp.]|nr:3',5'-cyclic-nucleotide phosphodiesterase [Geothrix sp.]
MELRVLGCSGGIGGGHRTTSFLVDGDVLIDAGSGVTGLSLDQMACVRHIFLTHSHLDHVHCIPLMVDSIFDTITEPIQVHGQPETLKALEEHLFNGVIWPDFTRLPHPERPVLKFVPMRPEQSVHVGRREFRMVPVNHIVPGVGYVVSSEGDGTFAFSGDTTTNDTFWEGLNRLPKLDLLVVEAAFSNEEVELCRLARHYCPELLAKDLKKLKHRPKVYLTHAKPGEEVKIFDECRALIRDREVHQLSGGEVFTL